MQTYLIRILGEGEGKIWEGEAHAVQVGSCESSNHNQIEWVGSFFSSSKIVITLTKLPELISLTVGGDIYLGKTNKKVGTDLIWSIVPVVSENNE